MSRVIPIDIRKEAHRRVSAVLRCLANRILTLADGKDRSVRITQEQAQALISPHMQCLQRNCPELVFWEPIARSLNMFFNDEENR